MSDETTLLPCPYCGGEATISDSALTGEWHVYCDNDCPVRPYTFNKQRAKAIAAWNTRTHGTLTAEQVREVVEKHWHDLPADYDMPEATALPEYSYDWQAIADDLNSMLRSEACEPNWTLQGKTQTQEFWGCECGNCGECFGAEDRSTFPFKMTIDKVNIPNFCPECGTKQKKEVAND